MPQYFPSFEPFEIFDEFNGFPGTHIKSFLISDIVNLNKWQATHEAAEAMDLLAREIDKQTNRHHKDALSTLETDVDGILKDDKGNL